MKEKTNTESKFGVRIWALLFWLIFEISYPIPRYVSFVVIFILVYLIVLKIQWIKNIYSR